MKGRLFYIVGASGSGKDSILISVRKKINSNLPLAVAHRYITRPAEAGCENYISLSDEEFTLRESRGLFTMNWQSHGCRYGIGSEINHWMDSGLHVLVNGSREYIKTAASLYDNMVVCLVETDREKLKARLLSRGRENLEEIEKRLERAAAFRVDYPGMAIINNDGSLEHAVGQILSLIARQ